MEVVSSDFISVIKKAGLLAVSTRDKGLQTKTKSGKDDIVTEADLAVS